MVHILLKPGLENFEHYFTSVWDEYNCAVVWAFFGIAFLWDWNENWPFPVNGLILPSKSNTGCGSKYLHGSMVFLCWMHRFITTPWLLWASQVKNPPAIQKTSVPSWVQKIPWRRDRLPIPVFLGFLVAQLVKNPPAMWETQVWFLSWEDPLEKETATHSSILAWRIPWTI